MKAIMIAAALLALLGACGGSTADHPPEVEDVSQGTCAALCERLPVRWCGAIDEGECLVACEADPSWNECWPGVMDLARCVAAWPVAECVDEKEICGAEHEAMTSCIETTTAAE